MIADATPITDSPAANRGSGMMNAHRSTHGSWRSMAVLIALAAVMLAASIAPALAATPITNCEELQNMRNNLAGDYYLDNDIDCSVTSGWNSGAGFEPIGNMSSQFTGTFDGKGYKITNLYINRSSMNRVGLFGNTSSESEITNVGLEEVDVTGSSGVGGLVGLNNGKITNCYSTGNVIGSSFSSGIGGLVGSNVMGTISNCYYTGNVTGFSEVGGLVGSNVMGTITNCNSTSNGLVGLNYVGGLVGFNPSGTITNCNSTSNGLFGLNYVGGLVGFNPSGTITNCNSTGGLFGSNYVGGLVGFNPSGTITNCYSTSSVGAHHIVSSELGGLVGSNLGGTITNCYSTGSVDGYSEVGGLVGFDHLGTITNSYWDTETSGQSSSDGGTGKTTAEMKQQATFENWDFGTIWAIEEGVTYPYLRRQPSITYFTPPSPVNDTIYTWRTFNVSVDQTVNVTWYLNETAQTPENESVTEANYTFHAEYIGEHNVSAVVENANGTDMQTWVWNVRENTPPVITIDAPTQSVPVRIPGGGQFRVNFTYTELNPANYTVTIRNATSLINSTTKPSVAGGTGMTVNESFNLNASAANGWYNATVEMYDNSSNYNISHQNNSVEKGSYDASISQPGNQTTEPGVNATYELNITNTGILAGTFTLALTNHDTANVAALDKTTITDLATGASQNVTLNVTDVSAGSHNVTVNVTSDDSKSEVASTDYIMTIIVGPTLALDNVNDITSDWGRSFNLNHSVTVTNATASNVNVSYNISWIMDNSTMGTISQGGVRWHNQTPSNPTVQNITIRVDTNTTTASSMNDSKTFDINITRRDINVTANPGSAQTVGVGDTFWINGSAKDEHNEAFIAKADLVKDGSIVNTTDVTNGNANFSTDESADGTYNFSIRFYNTSHYDNASTSNSTVTVSGPSLTLDNVNDITSDWGRDFDLNHSVTVTNATASNVNVSYNVSWITDNSTMGTIAKDGMKWHNQTRSNPTVQNIAVRVDANSTTGSVTNDSKTFPVNITKRNIDITSQPESMQSVGTDATFHINASVKDEYEEDLICKADLIKDGTIIESQDISSRNANFSITEPLTGTFNFSVRFYNLTHYDNASTSNSTVTVRGPTLALDNVDNVASDWGRSFNLNHSVTVTNATASNVNVSYNVSWILDDNTMGTIAKDGIKWHNQTRSNSTVQNITARVDATSTTGSATNDSKTFLVNITKRNMEITSQPKPAQTVDPDTTFHINASARDEYEDMLIGTADLVKDGTIIASQDISSGNANFSRTEPLAGTFNFSVRFYNLTHYNNASTSNSSVTINGPTLALGNVTGITSDWGINFNLNHSVTVTNATATNVNVNYNVSWLTECTLGTVNKDATGWGNQTVSNSTVQQITVRVNANSTNTSTVNDTGTFQVNITKRDINITSHPPATQTVKPGATFRINAIAEGKYAENFIGNAILVRNGIVVDAPKAVTDGNVSFNLTESTTGTYDFSIRFYNLTYYFNASTDNSSVNVKNPPTPPSSSSGGGIGVSSGNEPGNVDETIVLMIYLRAGSSSTYNFNNVVTSVEVTPDRNYGMVAARIEVLHGQPSGITSDLPAGELFKYVNLFVGTTGWAEGKFSSSVINFQIPASWFEENNIDPESVVMYRHHGDEWKLLTTTMTGQAGGFYMYSSPSPGFSTFLILGQVRDSGTGEPADAPDSGTKDDSTPTSTPEATSTKGTPGFGILVGIMGILVAVYSRRK